MPKYFDEEYKKEQELLENYYKKDKVSKEFYKHFTVVYWCLIKFNQLEQKVIDPATYVSIEKSFKDADTLLNIEEYEMLLDNFVLKSMKKATLKNNLYSTMEFAIKNFTNQNIIDYLLYSNINNVLNNREVETTVSTDVIDIFLKNCKNQEYINEINQDLQVKKTPVIIQNIIKNYAGKLVFVDFWASWCMPSREEFPSEKKLIKKFLNVAFIFLSIDKSSIAWQKAMAEYDDILNGGNSFLLVKSDKDELLKQIDIRTIPRFVLFGKDGKIINPDAPRPSSPEIEALLKKYLWHNNLSKYDFFYKL